MPAPKKSGNLLNAPHLYIFITVIHKKKATHLQVEMTIPAKDLQ